MLLWVYRWRVLLTGFGVGALAALLRFVNLSYPDSLSFDEVYYAREAYSILEMGYGGRWEGEATDFNKGDYSGLITTADKVVHPMLGKLMIAVGMKIFGTNPFGWRFMSAVIGTLTVILVFLIARKLFNSTIWGGVAGSFLAIDGQHIVQSRHALLDIFLTFWVVVAFGCLVADRSRAKATLGRKAAKARARLGLAPGDAIPETGGGLGIRWWRFAAVVALGLATGVKWSGLMFAIFFLVLSVIQDLVDRRDAGFRLWGKGAMVRSALPAAAMSAIVYPLAYLATWTQWFLAPLAYDRRWAADHPGEGFTFLPPALRSLVQYHIEMLEFHKGLTHENGFDHKYESAPWTWIIQLRPVAYFFASVKDPNGGPCGAPNCSAALTSLGNPLLWWTGALLLGFAIYRVLAKADMLAATVIVGTLAGWLPWFQYSHRVIFSFYSTAFVPYVVLTVVWGLRHFAQPERLRGGWSRRAAIAAGGFVGATFVISGFFLPIWIAQWIPYYYWLSHMWLGHFWI